MKNCFEYSTTWHALQNQRKPNNRIKQKDLRNSHSTTFEQSNPSTHTPHPSQSHPLVIIIPTPIGPSTPSPSFVPGAKILFRRIALGGPGNFRYVASAARWLNPIQQRRRPPPPPFPAGPRGISRPSSAPNYLNGEVFTAPLVSGADIEISRGLSRARGRNARAAAAAARVTTGKSLITGWIKTRARARGATPLQCTTRRSVN